MVTYNEQKLLDLTFAEWEGVGTWYEYLVKYRIFKKLKNIKTVLVAGLPQEYGISADMLLFAKYAKLTVIDDRKDKLEQFKKLAKDFGFSKNVIIKQVKSLTKLPFKDNNFDLVSNTEVIQRLKNPKEIIREMERVSKKHIMVFVPNAYYYSHYIITKIGTFKMKDIIKACNYPLKAKGYLDRPPWPAGVAVSATGFSFTEGSKAKERKDQNQKGQKESFFVKLIKDFFLFSTPALAFSEVLYPTPLRELLSHMFFVHTQKN